MKLSEFRVSNHRRVFLLGKNGSGKTTLLKSLRTDNAFYLPQEVFVEKEVTISDFFKIASYRLPLDETKAGEVLVSLGSALDFNSPLCEVSSGERQKVFLATYLYLGAKTLLLDEPTSFLDPKAKRLFAETLLKLSDVNFVIATHDLELVKQLDPWVVGLRDCLVMFEGKFESICLESLYS